MSVVPMLLLQAIIMVESSGDDRAVGRGGELGCMQISAIAKRDILRITGGIPSNRFNREQSIGMARAYLEYYVTRERLGREPTLRDYALVWHRGPEGWTQKSYSAYWDRVMDYLPSVPLKITLELPRQ
jgi:soluble lytic murein transglycosylase-like protein